MHFSGVTNKVHRCLRFPCGSRHLVPALVSHTSLIFVCDTKLMCDTNTAMLKMLAVTPFSKLLEDTEMCGYSIFS